MAFSLIDLENKQISKDKKKLDIIKNLRKQLVILKTDKGNDIVLLNNNDYYNGVEKLLQDKQKFKQTLEEPTPFHLTSVQRYPKKLNKKGELTNDMYDKIRPKSAKLVGAHRLPKIHKVLKNIPSFRPIIETTGTTHYSVGTYLCKLLNPSLILIILWKIPSMQPRELAESFLKSVKKINTCLSHWMLFHYSQTFH